MLFRIKRRETRRQRCYRKVLRVLQAISFCINLGVLSFFTFSGKSSFWDSNELVVKIWFDEFQCVWHTRDVSITEFGRSWGGNTVFFLGENWGKSSSSYKEKDSHLIRGGWRTLRKNQIRGESSSQNTPQWGLVSIQWHLNRRMNEE